MSASEYLQNQTIDKSNRYLDALIHHANIGNIATFNSLTRDFYKLNFDDREVWISILHMISGIIVGINPLGAIYSKIIELLETHCSRDKISTIINTPFTIGESTNIKIIQLVTQFVNARGNYIDGVDIDNTDEEMDIKRNIKIDEALSVRFQIFESLVSYDADIYNMVPYNIGDNNPISYNLSPIESLILNIHALLYKKNKDSAKAVDFERALEFSYNIIFYLINAVDTNGLPRYNIIEMIEHISTGIKYILYSEKCISLIINFIIKKKHLGVAINVFLTEYYFLPGVLVAYIDGTIDYSVLLLILYNAAIKIEHFLYKNTNNIVLQLLIDAERITQSNDFKIINSFITILNNNVGTEVKFHEYPLLLNWLLELEYIPIIDKLLPKGLFLTDSILTDIFARSAILPSNESKLYCFKVIKSILPYSSIRHFAGTRNIISILSPNKNKNLNYSDLYKKLSIRKKELVAPIIANAKIIDKKNAEDKGGIVEEFIVEEFITEEVIVKKPKKIKRTKPVAVAPASKTTNAPFANATSANASSANASSTNSSSTNSSHVGTVIEVVDAMLELTKIATNEEVGKIYNSMAALCKIATDRGTVLCIPPVATLVEEAIITKEEAIITKEGTIITKEAAIITKEEDAERRRLAIHQKKIIKRREKLTTFNCILSELYRIVAGVIINNFDNNIRFIIISECNPRQDFSAHKFCLIFETSDSAHIEPLIDGLEEIFQHVEFNAIGINMNTHPIADICPSIQIKLLLCNAHSKLFNDNNILISSRSVDNVQILNYLNMQKISEYKTLFIDTASMVATYPILSAHRAILYQIDNIVSDTLLGSHGGNGEHLRMSNQYDIVLYGSYGFGAELSTSDIDICILLSTGDSNYISHLISAFSCSGNTAITFTNIKFIPSSFKSPNLIMMDTDQYHIDLAFSNVQPIVFNSCDGNILEFLNNKYIELSLIEYSYLFVDHPSVCASYALLLGYHIISTVPDLKAYNDALIQIKINSIDQKIYGSNTGYLNGSTLAIMVLYVAISSCSDGSTITASSIVMEFYRIFSDWDWNIYGLIINSKHPPLKLSKLEINQLDHSMNCQKFAMFVGTYGACVSCTVWPDTLYQIQMTFKLQHLNISPAICDNTTISKLVINGYFSERGLAKKIQMIAKEFRKNINCDYNAYSHYTSRLLIYPEPCIEGIIICVNVANFFTGLNYNKFLAIANGVIANEAMHW